MHHVRPCSLLRRTVLHVVAVASLALVGCGPPRGGIDDPEAARLAYLGLDRAVDRALQLGFDGFNAASNANIPEQSGMGDASGTMTFAGQIDQGSSDNKEMRLQVTLDDYSDGPVEDETDILYDGGPNAFELSLRGFPNADLTGTLTGDFLMSGDLAGAVTLDLSFTGQTEEAPGGGIQRKAGTIRVVGTATSDYGTFEVDVSL